MIMIIIRMALTIIKKDSKIQKKNQMMIQFELNRQKQLIDDHDIDMSPSSEKKKFFFSSQEFAHYT